jgi:NADH-quinone oxidoreductase subunit M
VFVPILFLIFWMGVAPQPFIDRMAPSIERTIELSQARMHSAEMMSATPVRRTGTVADLATPAVNGGPR